MLSVCKKQDQGAAGQLSWEAISIVHSHSETDNATRFFLLITLFVWHGCQLIEIRAERTGWHNHSQVRFVPGKHWPRSPRRYVYLPRSHFRWILFQENIDWCVHQSVAKLLFDRNEPLMEKVYCAAFLFLGTRGACWSVAKGSAACISQSIRCMLFSQWKVCVSSWLQSEGFSGTPDQDRRSHCKNLQKHGLVLGYLVRDCLESSTSLEKGN